MSSTIFTSSALPRTATPVLVVLNRVLLIAASALLLAYFAVYVAFAINLMQFPFDYDQGEGFELVDTILFSQGILPYQNTDAYPFYASNYPPLFHIMAAPFVWLFGPAYWYGRLLGFLGTLVTASAIGYAVYREGGQRWIAVLAGLAFLASNTVYHIGPLFRQHMTMVMFETLAVVILCGANEIRSTHRRRLVLAVGMAMLLCAGYTKQLAAVTALAAFLFLFLRQPRRAIVWAVGFAATGGLIFLWLNLATDGQWYIQAIAANVNTYYPEKTIGLYRLWFSLHGFLIMPAVLYLLYELYCARLSIYSVWFVAAVGAGALSGQWGAGDSYFATSIAATCVLSGILFARLLKGSLTMRATRYARALARHLRPVGASLRPAALLAVPMLYLGYGAAVLHMPTTGALVEPVAQILGIEPNATNGFYDSAGRITGGYADIGHFTTEADIANGWRIVEAVRAADGPVLSEEAAFTLLAGKEVVTNPTQLLNLWLNGLYDSTELVRMLDEQAFGLVVLRAQFYPVPVLEAIQRNYSERERIPMNGFDYLLLYPRDTPLTEAAVAR
jgi:hypothetical protein